MSDLPSITARNLGQILLPAYCRKCFYYLLRMKFHPPFNSFGAGIFNAMQTIQESIITYYLKKDGCLPKEFAPYCNCCARVDVNKHWSKFRYTHESGVILYGIPDDVLWREDGTICLLDYKTAKFKGKDDQFHNQYVVQIVGYANILEIGLKLGTVSLAGLLYWEIQVDAVKANPIGFYSDATVHVPFIPKPLEIKVDYSILDPLCEEVNKLWEADTPPEGRNGCKDCKKLDLLFGIEDQIVAKDSRLLSKFLPPARAQKEITTRAYERMTARLAALRDMDVLGEEAFEEDGMVANWEFPMMRDIAVREEILHS